MNKRMFFLSFSILFVQLNVFYQQTFKASGLIQDDHGNPIEGAAIKVLNTEIGTLSDKNGRFIFSSIPMKYESIEVSAIGYATLIVNFR
ncbi:MAG: carboxypeptidase-like regulatory domain-containing protein, partial [Chitinophagaceae bacterium]